MDRTETRPPRTATLRIITLRRLSVHWGSMRALTVRMPVTGGRKSRSHPPQGGRDVAGGRPVVAVMDAVISTDPRLQNFHNSFAAAGHGRALYRHQRCRERRPQLVHRLAHQRDQLGHLGLVIRRHDSPRSTPLRPAGHVPRLLGHPSSWQPPARAGSTTMRQYRMIGQEVPLSKGAHRVGVAPASNLSCPLDLERPGSVTTLRRRWLRHGPQPMASAGAQRCR